MKTRIWELDALRGICILGMVLVHLLYDLGGSAFDHPVIMVLRLGGGILFVLLSGLCVTLGRHHVKR